MNVEEFVRESLSQVFRGVKAAASAAQETGAEISPNQYGPVGQTTNNLGRAIGMITFDVAVTVTETGDVKGGISVLGIGVKGAMSDLSSTVSRIKFRVPVTLPAYAPSDKGGGSTT